MVGGSADGTGFGMMAAVEKHLNSNEHHDGKPYGKTDTVDVLTKLNGLRQQVSQSHGQKQTSCNKAQSLAHSAEDKGRNN